MSECTIRFHRNKTDIEDLQVFNFTDRKQNFHFSDILEVAKVESLNTELVQTFSVNQFHSFQQAQC